MTAAPEKFNPHKDVDLISLAREIAIDHYPVEDILRNNGISPSQWEDLRYNPRFIELLKLETTAWNSAVNTPSRIKLKSAAVVELYLEQAYNDLISPGHSLNHRVALLAQLSKFAAIEQNDKESRPTDGVNITINIGDTQLKYNADIAKTIEAEASEDADEFDWENEFVPDIQELEPAE